MTIGLIIQPSVLAAGYEIKKAGEQVQQHNCRVPVAHCHQSNQVIGED